jgi:thiamine biosynthesis lipoprotein
LEDSQQADQYELTRQPEGWRVSFKAMASPCEVLVADDTRDIAGRVGELVVNEARRIERKFSRYRDDSVIGVINRSAGQWVEVDEETSRLLAYADKLHELSGGRFDITSGVLRRVWRFDGSDRLPDPAAVDAVRASIGWQRVDFDGSRIRLEPGMEVDLGGIGKEYAVDRAGLLAQSIAPHCLINFGGDLVATATSVSQHRWNVAIEHPEADGKPPVHIALMRGGIATSGDAQRFLLRNGKRYGHILDPLTGWPVENAPRSVTVAAPSCTLAGMTATFAMLHGADAERFLEDEGFEFWCLR